MNDYESVKKSLIKRYNIREAEFSDSDNINGYIYHIGSKKIVFPHTLIKLCGNDKWVEFVNLITKYDTMENSENYVLYIQDLLFVFDDLDVLNEKSEL